MLDLESKPVQPASGLTDFFKKFRNEPGEATETKLIQVIIFQIPSDPDSEDGNFIT